MQSTNKKRQFRSRGYGSRAADFSHDGMKGGMMDGPTIVAIALGALNVLQLAVLGVWTLRSRMEDGGDQDREELKELIRDGDGRIMLQIQEAKVDWNKTVEHMQRRMDGFDVRHNETVKMMWESIGSANTKVAVLSEVMELYKQGQLSMQRERHEK